MHYTFHVKRLNKYKVLSVHVDRLHEQMEELTDLSEEVDNHREPEQELQDIGADLMRHISSDEALQLKDKLDSISHRYSDLETKAGSLLKNAQEVLPLVHAFHKAHTSLNDWLVDTEQTLLAVDTLPSPDETVEHLEQQVSAAECCLLQRASGVIFFSRIHTLLRLVV